MKGEEDPGRRRRQAGHAHTEQRESQEGKRRPHGDAPAGAWRETGSEQRRRSYTGEAAMLTLTVRRGGWEGVPCSCVIDA